MKTLKVLLMAIGFIGFLHSQAQNGSNALGGLVGKKWKGFDMKMSTDGLDQTQIAKMNASLTEAAKGMSLTLNTDNTFILGDASGEKKGKYKIDGKNLILTEENKKDAVFLVTMVAPNYIELRPVPKDADDLVLIYKL
jgi:hypothetical protein